MMRSVHAASHTTLSVNGVPTGPLHLFIQMLSRHVRDIDPYRVAVCWDGGRSTHRTAIFEGYKSNRDGVEAHPDRVPTTTLIEEFLGLAGFWCLTVQGVEADDLIAYYWEITDHRDEVVILSGDKDFLMLLDETTTQVRPGTEKTGGEIWTVDRVREDLGCLPMDLVSVMALTGDAIDGVPGVPGIGIKTACKLLARYDWSLEALMASSEKKVAGYRAVVERNRALVDLRSPRPAEMVLVLPHGTPPLFQPTDPSSSQWSVLVEFLDLYRMERTKDRLLAGTLWRGSNAPPEDLRMSFDFSA